MKMLAALGWTDFEGLEETEKLWMEGIAYMKAHKRKGKSNLKSKYLVWNEDVNK